MKAEFAFVPPGGGAVDYSLDFDIPAIPRPGDYITISRAGESGASDFIVRRARWLLEYKDDQDTSAIERGAPGFTKKLVIECEFAIGMFSNEEHLSSCELYRNRGKPPQKHE